MLKSKKILIVGAGGLLGSSVVNALLQQGASVIAADVNEEQMQERLISQGIEIDSQQLFLLQLDVNCEISIKEFFKKVDKLDGAVNCTYPRNKSYGKHFFDVTLDDFNENISLHLGSSFLFAQQCAAYFLRENKPFSLVNISSVYGVIAPKFNIYDNTKMTMPVEYAAIKSSLIHLNKYIAKYMANSDFRINSVSPGGIFDSQPEAFLKAYTEQTLGRGMLDAKDITGAILFLLSDNSKYMNGQNLVIDDGFTL